MQLDLTAVRSGAASAAQSGIPHAELLVRFAEALVAHDDTALAALRAPLREAVGDEGLRETASVAANFQRMVRIADATGIPQDAPVMALGSDVVEELALRDFASAANTPESRLAQLVGKLLRPVAPAMLAVMARRAKRSRRSTEAEAG